MLFLTGPITWQSYFPKKFLWLLSSILCSTCNCVERIIAEIPSGFTKNYGPLQRLSTEITNLIYMHQCRLLIISKGAGLSHTSHEPVFLYSEGTKNKTKTKTKNLAGENHLLMCVWAAWAIICNLVFPECRAQRLGLIKIPLSRPTRVQVLCNLGLFSCIFLYFERAVLTQKAPFLSTLFDSVWSAYRCI